MARKFYTLLISSLAVFLIQAQQPFSNYTQTIPGTNIEFPMVAIEGDTFNMGSPDKEKGRNTDEGPQVPVIVSSFWMGTYEVTYDLYELFMYESKDPDPKPDAISRPSPPYIDFTRGMGKQGGFPANSMSQYAALTFCKWLYQKTGVFYRLPTEAEWEFACRAGSTTAYPFGNKDKLLAEYAWYNKNSGNKYHKVGELKPNAWGLYDMLGNVAEWTMDEYRPDYLTTITPLTTDPKTEPVARHPRTLKGGCFSDGAEKTRAAARLPSSLEWNRRDPQLPKSKWWNTDAPFVGFRLIRPYPAPDATAIAQFFQTQLVTIK